MGEPPAVRVRRATPNDLATLFAWRNDPATRAASISPGEVVFTEHAAWFAAALASRDRHIYLVFIDGNDSVTDVGMCRFDRTGSEVEVSINLAPESRGRGMATAVLEASIEAFLSEEPATITLTATIRDSNEPSIRTFTRTGFRRMASIDGVGSYRKSARTGPS